MKFFGCKVGHSQEFVGILGKQKALKSGKYSFYYTIIEEKIRI